MISKLLAERKQAQSAARVRSAGQADWMDDWLAGWLAGWLAAQLAGGQPVAVSPRRVRASMSSRKDDIFCHKCQKSCGRKGRARWPNNSKQQHQAAIENNNNNNNSKNYHRRP